MHFHLPKPLHGWRAFAGEVGIIVLGVLLALGAEQVVETLQWRAEVREFRKAVDHELALNLATFRINELQRPCTRRRLDELQTILDRANAGQSVPPLGKIAGPATFSQYSSVWDNKNADVVAHLPTDVRLKYGELYDEFRNTADIKEKQTQVWAEFTSLEVPGPLTLDDRRKLHSAIVRARNFDNYMEGDWPVSAKLAKDLGIQPAYIPEMTDFMRKFGASARCKRIFGAAGMTTAR